MEKLELLKKAVSNYFPYDIKYKAGNSMIKTVRALNRDGVYCETDFAATPFKEIKLILRSLSDLTMEIYFDIGFKEFDILILEKTKGIQNLPYWMVEILIKNHFDIYGLIEKGLAINKNEL